MTDKNRIGSGGFGMVYRSLFHGEEMAMKFTLVEVGIRDFIREDFEKKISELIIQKKVGNSSVIPRVNVLCWSAFLSSDVLISGD